MAVEQTVKTNRIGALLLNTPVVADRVDISVKGVYYTDTTPKDAYVVDNRRLGCVVPEATMFGGMVAGEQHIQSYTCGNQGCWYAVTSEGTVTMTAHGGVVVTATPHQNCLGIFFNSVRMVFKGLVRRFAQ